MMVILYIYSGNRHSLYHVCFWGITLEEPGTVYNYLPIQHMTLSPFSIHEVKNNTQIILHPFPSASEGNKSMGMAEWLVGWLVD